MVLCSPKARNKFSEKKRKKKWLQIRRIIEVENWLLLCHLIGNLFGSLRWKISYNWKLNYLGPRWPQLLSSPSHPCDHKVDDLEVFMFLLIFSLFSCPEQLNRTHCWRQKLYFQKIFRLSEVFFFRFWLWLLRYLIRVMRKHESCHDLTNLTILKISTIFDNFYNYW